MKYKIFVMIIALLLALTACQGALPLETGQPDPKPPAAMQWNEGIIVEGLADITCPPLSALPDHDSSEIIETEGVYGYQLALPDDWANKYELIEKTSTVSKQTFLFSVFDSYNHADDVYDSGYLFTIYITPLEDILEVFPNAANETFSAEHRIFAFDEETAFVCAFATGQNYDTEDIYAEEHYKDMEQDIKQILARFADINDLTPNAGFFDK